MKTLLIHSMRTLLVLSTLGAIAKSNAITTDSVAPYTNVKIPHIDSIVYNFSIYVKPYSGWKATDVITYTLQGYNKTSKDWQNVFGIGPQSNTLLEFSDSEPVKINVLVPRFDDNLVKYRLQFMQSNGTNPLQFGFVPLKTATVDNNGSIPGNTYTLSFQQGAPGNLTPNGVAANAISRPTHPPKLDTLTVNGQIRKVFYVWNQGSSHYEPFFVRGIDYESTPVGQLWVDGQPDTANGETVFLADFNKSGGGQICRTLSNGPYGTSVSYCFDTDLNGQMHQYLNNTSLGAFADTANKLLKARWERDIKVMQAMGVNTIRIYHHDAMVRNMTDFLDLAYQYGIFVIMPAPAPNGSQLFSTSPKTGRLQTYSEMTKPGNSGQAWTALMQLMLAKYGAHPAILAWAVGNETGADNPTSPQPAAAEIEWILAKTIKNFDSRILVTATNQDHYNTTKNFKAYYNLFLESSTGTDTYLDFYSINSYRGIAPNQLQLTGMETLLDILDSLQPPYDLPLLISEWGKNDNYSFEGIDNQFGFSRLWRMVLQRKSNLLGVAYFEFSDEPIAKNLEGQHYMGVVAYSLRKDFKADGIVQIDSLIPKFKNYNGILNKINNDTVQYYPAVKMAGVFDAFIGDNTNPLVQDPDITTVPNIGYCAFSQSKEPWSINQKCLTVDAQVNNVPPYKIKVTHGDNDNITEIQLNGTIVKKNSKQNTSGIILIKLKSKTGETGLVQLGFNAPGDIPVSSMNTLLTNNVDSPPTVSWKNNNGCISISLPPVSN
jgi:hypothetical protein